MAADMMSETFNRGTSEIDWCESNYKVNSSIAEFWNTISNTLYFVIPPILMYLFQPYARQVNKMVHVVWFMLICVGGASAYFHATLSLFGQLLDEIAILWVVLAAYATWFPKKYIPLALLDDTRSRKPFQLAILLCCCLATVGCMIKPILNAFLLNMLGIPSVILLIYEICRCDVDRVVRLGMRCCVMWFLAIFCWLNDRLLCDAWSAINFPYLHCVWHVLILLSSYCCLVVFAFFEAQTEFPELSPCLNYWPTNEWEWGIPYVKLKHWCGKQDKPE